VILIFSLSRDQGTNGVAAWLDHYGQEVVRINDDEPGLPEVVVELDHQGLRFHVDGKSYADSDISAIWYRTGHGWFPAEHHVPEFPDQDSFNALLQRKLKAESRIAAEYFHHLMRDRGVRTLGNPFLGDPNKLILLHEARRVGLKVPPFEVIDRLSDRHRANASRYVTKALSDGIYHWDNDGAQRGYFSYTEELGEVLKAGAADGAIPLSLLQEKIEKSFEVRSFYLDGTFTSAAIYSQEDAQTAVDFRKYNQDRPNRNVPIKLPEDVAAKLTALFRKIELNTGSVDMIVDRDGDFVFLEINPMGIYGGIAAICNFNIDQSIARWLSGVEKDESIVPARAVGRAGSEPPARLSDHLFPAIAQSE
jgi:ATP-GRASP peptide maturase of grasp-with-spasm system